MVVKSIHGDDSKDHNGHMLVHWHRQLLLRKYGTWLQMFWPRKVKGRKWPGGGCKVGRRSDKPQQSIMSLVIRKQKRLKNVFCKTEMAALISAGWWSSNLYPFRGEMTTFTLGRMGPLEKQKPPEYSISLWSQVTGGFVISLCRHPSPQVTRQEVEILPSQDPNSTRPHSALTFL